MLAPKTHLHVISVVSVKVLPALLLTKLYVLAVS